MTIGDRYAAKPLFAATAHEGTAQKLTGRVVYIHPQNRYVTLEFEGGLRECFDPKGLEALR